MSGRCDFCGECGIDMRCSDCAEQAVHGFVAAAVATEREACAKVVEEIRQNEDDKLTCDALTYSANAIRARGKEQGK